MKSNFEYRYVTTVLDKLEVEDIGNCAIHIHYESDKLHKDYFLVIKTESGTTYVIQSTGSVNGIKFSGYTYNYFVSDYKEKRIQKTIQKFLDTYCLLDEKVEVISIEEALQKISEINFSELGDD